MKAYVEERFKHISSEELQFYNEGNYFRSRIDEAVAIKNYKFFDLYLEDLKRLAVKGRVMAATCTPMVLKLLLSPDAALRDWAVDTLSGW